MDRGSVSRILLALALTLTAGLGIAAPACGGGGGAALSKAEFTERADKICVETWARFASKLPDPVGGAKPVGLGAFMREWIERLRTLEPPQSVLTHWYRGLELLEQASYKFDDAENGDPDAQGEALWSLEPQAQEQFVATRLPFRACFVE